jgi:hypothetical protein
MGEKKRRAAAGASGGDWETTRFNSGACLNCGLPFTGLTGPASHPDKGSLMVCGACGYVSEWDGEKHVELSEATMAEASADPDVAAVLAAICEDCGKLEELRPYGHKKPDGKRKWVCFPCAHKDEAELNRAFDERIEGENPV